MKSRNLYFSWLLIAVVAVAIAFVTLKDKTPAAHSGALASNDSTATSPHSSLPGKKATVKEIVWNHDFEAAMQQAKKEHRPVMIDFYTDWCSACKILDRDTYTDPAVIAEAQHFITIKINAEKRTDLRDAYGVTGYPTIIWANSEGKPFGSLPGAMQTKEFTEVMRGANKAWLAIKKQEPGTSL